MLKIGVTGGIGSGKTSICNAFKALGVPVFNSDQVAKGIINTDPEIKQKLIKSFGKEIYLSDGLINKDLFRSILFGDDKALQISNSIIHPLVRSAFNDFVIQNNHKDLIIQEAAILFENDAYQHLNKIVLVICPLEERIARVVLRDKFDRQKILGINNKQWTDEKKLKLADYVVYNSDNDLVLPQILNIYENLKILSTMS